MTSNKKYFQSNRVPGLSILKHGSPGAFQKCPGGSMTSARMNHIPLKAAYVCQDCDAVGNNAMQCPACASQVLMGLAGVFDRKEVNAEDSLFLFPAMELKLCRLSNMRRGQTVPFSPDQVFRTLPAVRRTL